MPVFTTDGRSHFVSYITGPQHILLGVEFGETSIDPPLVTKLPPIGGCTHGVIDEHMLVQVVLDGIREESDQTAIIRHVRSITYVENDSPNYRLYQHCARLIVKALASGTTFGSRTAS